MDKVSFFNLFLEFHSMFHTDHPLLYMSVYPFCIYLESESFPNGQIDQFVSFFSDYNVDFTYSCFYIHTRLCLIFTFNVV